MQNPSIHQASVLTVSIVLCGFVLYPFLKHRPSLSHFISMRLQTIKRGKLLIKEGEGNVQVKKKKKKLDKDPYLSKHEQFCLKYIHQCGYP